LGGKGKKRATHGIFSEQRLRSVHHLGFARGTLKKMVSCLKKRGKNSVWQNLGGEGLDTAKISGDDGGIWKNSASDRGCGKIGEFGGNPKWVDSNRLG